MNTNRKVLFLAALLVVASPAVAQEKQLADGYRFSGNAPAGKFDEGTLALERQGGSSYVVHAREKSDRAWDGRATLAGRLLTIARDENPTVGEAGALEGLVAGPKQAYEYVALFDEDLERASVRIYRVKADGAREELGQGTLASKKRLWEKLPGDLLAIARKEVDRAIHDPIDFKEEFSVLSYGHIGMRVAAELLADGERTPFMKEHDRVFRAEKKAEPIWVRTVVEGGPRVAYSVSVPLDGSSGAVRLDAGFQLGAKVRYTCDEPHARPEGITDGKGILEVIEKVPARTFALPFSADKAVALPLGARRTLAGDGNLAISGGVSFGYKLEELGVLKDKAEVGLHGGLGVTWSITGDLELLFQREDANKVRLRWSRATHKAIGVQAQALIGAYVSDKLIDQVPDPASSGVKAIVREGRKYTTIEFGGSVSWSDAKDLVIDMLFDLGDPQARAAYEDAVFGNLLKVQELAASGSPAGLLEYRITTTLTDALTWNASFKAFEVLKFNANARTATVKIDVESLDGTKSTTDVFSYEKTSHGLFGGDKNVKVDAIDRTVVHPAGETDRGSRVSFHFERGEDRTSRDEVDADLALAARIFGDDAVAADRARIEATRPYDHGDKPKLALGHGNEYRKTRFTLDVMLGTRAIERVLAAGDDAFYAAYGRASGDEPYEWTPARRAMLKKVPLAIQDGRNGQPKVPEELRHEAWVLHDANAVAKLVQQARGAATPALRVETFRRLAKTDGFKGRGLVALALLAGRDDCRVELSLKGDKVAFSYASGDAAPLPEHR